MLLRSIYQLLRSRKLKLNFFFLLSFNLFTFSSYYESKLKFILASEDKEKENIWKKRVEQK